MAGALSEAVRREILRLLAERDWSGRELARRSGLAQPNVARKLAGTRRWDLDDLQPVCKALEVPVEVLIERALDH